ncbi:MAG: hypothetical protein KGK08_12840, partial [Acidobacteriota bacterium]|nr:hypothetical protein [Acidobacteriota bacterium]
MFHNLSENRGFRLRKSPKLALWREIPINSRNFSAYGNVLLVKSFAFFAHQSYLQLHCDEARSSWQARNTLKKS